MKYRQENIILTEQLMSIHQLNPNEANEFIWKSQIKELIENMKMEDLNKMFRLTVETVEWPQKSYKYTSQITIK